MTDEKGNDVVTETNSREHERHHRLTRYADYDEFSFFYSEALDEFPRGPIQITARGRTCGALSLDWEATAEVIAEMFNRPEWEQSEEVKQRISKAAADEAVLHVLEFLPEKIDAALEQLCQEAVIGFFKRRSVIRRIGLPSLAQTVESIVQSEEEAIKARLNIRTGPVPAFLNRDHYENVLLGAAGDILSSGGEVTQRTIADQLAKRQAEVEAEVTIEERMIRRWNREFGLDWRHFMNTVRLIRDRTNSA